MYWQIVNLARHWFRSGPSCPRASGVSFESSEYARKFAKVGINAANNHMFHLRKWASHFHPFSVYFRMSNTMFEESRVVCKAMLWGQVTYVAPSSEHQSEHFFLPGHVVSVEPIGPNWPNQLLLVTGPASCHHFVWHLNVTKMVQPCSTHIFGGALWGISISFIVGLRLGPTQENESQDFKFCHPHVAKYCFNHRFFMFVSRFQAANHVFSTSVGFLLRF